MADSCVTGHTAFVYDRGGMTRLGEIKDMASIQWYRDRDAVSQADIVIAGDNCEHQSDFLTSIEPKRHELVIFRGKERVWEGPIWRVGWEPDRITINAHDVLEYLYWTPLTRVWDNRGALATEATTRQEEIIAYQLTTNWSIPQDDPTPDIPVLAWENVDPPANVLPFLTVHHWPNEARTAAYTEAFEMGVGEHLQYTARHGGIDFVAVGRAIHIWDTSRPLGRTRMLTDADFLAGAIVTAYGADHAVFGMVRADNGLVGYAWSDDTYYGPWAKIFSVYDQEATQEPTQPELNSQAWRNISGRNPVPVEVRIPDNTGIRLDSTLTINDLIPGVQMPLLATLNARKISQDQKLDKVTVRETGSEGETIQVTLTPATTPDSNEEEE
jgi:hypothetical protein